MADPNLLPLIDADETYSESQDILTEGDELSTSSIETLEQEQATPAAPIAETKVAATQPQPVQQAPVPVSQPSVSPAQPVALQTATVTAPVVAQPEGKKKREWTEAQKQANKEHLARIRQM